MCSGRVASADVRRPMRRRLVHAVLALLLAGCATPRHEEVVVQATVTVSRHVERSLEHAWFVGLAEHAWFLGLAERSWFTALAQPIVDYQPGACGGDLPPCYVMWRESRGLLTAMNPASTASGKWQFLDSTWAGYDGYARAAYAPEAVQDARARIVWANGAGCANWSAC